MIVVSAAAMLMLILMTDVSRESGWSLEWRFVLCSVQRRRQELEHDEVSESSARSETAQDHQPSSQTQGAFLHSDPQLSLLPSAGWEMTSSLRATRQKLDFSTADIFCTSRTDSWTAEPRVIAFSSLLFVNLQSQPPMV